MHVLLIDADPTARETVKAVLHRMVADVEVEEVSTSEALAPSLDRDDSDLVIADTQLPGGKRLGVLNALRAHRPRIPAILFTSTSREEVVMAAVNAGVEDYVLKSHNCARRLETAIRSALHRRTMGDGEAT
jgi:HTH-type transcriptional regulator, bacterioopsin transcriptional activator and related proteins